MKLRDLMSKILRPTRMELRVYRDAISKTRIVTIDITESWGVDFGRDLYLTEELLDMTVGPIQVLYDNNDVAILSVEVYRYEEES